MYRLFLVLGNLSIEVSDQSRLSKLAEGELLVFAHSPDQAFCAARAFKKGYIARHRLPLAGKLFEVIVADDVQQGCTRIEKGLVYKNDLGCMHVPEIVN